MISATPQLKVTLGKPPQLKVTLGKPQPLEVQINPAAAIDVTIDKMTIYQGYVKVPEHTHRADEVLYDTEADLTILNVKSALDKLLYVPLSINLNSNKGTTEKGTILNDIVFTWGYNKKINSQRFEGIELDTTVRDYAYPSPVSNNKTFTLVANDGKSDFTRSVSINFANGRYWGVSNSSTYDNALILSLSRELVESKSKTFTVTCGEGQYIFYSIPTRLGTPTFTVGGFSGGFTKVVTIPFTNASGFVENYDIWKSTNTNLGNTTVVVS